MVSASRSWGRRRRFPRISGVPSFDETVPMGGLNASISCLNSYLGRLVRVLAKRLLADRGPEGHRPRSSEVGYLLTKPTAIRERGELSAARGVMDRG